MHIRYFAWLREIIGHANEEVEVTAKTSLASVADLVAHLRATSPAHAKALADMDRVRVAVNYEYVPLTHPINTGDEVAFFPPVTGG